MNPLNLFILNVHQSADLGISLRNILAHSADFHVDLLMQSIDHEDPAASPLSSAVADHLDKADITFLVSSCLRRSEVHSIISHISEKRQNLPIIMVSEEGSPDEIIEYLRTGVADYLAPPLRAVDIIPRLWRMLDHARQRSTLVHAMKTKIGLTQLIGKSPAFRAVLDTIPVISRSDVGVQISGETGTGKELCARAIHYLGPRAHKPFLPVNCGAIPAELVENELFGHVRGAFTGATHPHGGLISEADGGTLFLDEIDCLPLPAQIKLLRFVQEKEFRQLGSSKQRRADVRIIAATNANLERAVQAGTFRQDLFYRLNIVHLSLPPLRERREDILLLARHFLAQSAADEGKDISDFSSAAMNLLCGYGWPGNVRELENVVRRAVIFAKGGLIQDSELALPRPAASILQESFKAEKAKVVADFEREYMQGLLRACQGNITKAATAAQKNRRAFWELLRKYEIDVESFKSPSPKSRT